MIEMSKDIVPVTAAVNEVAPLPSGWTIHKVAALVQALAVQMYDVPTILKEYNLTYDQYKVLETNEFFKKAMEVAVIDWHKSTSIQKRLALEAATTLEAVMPTVFARMQKADEPLPGIIEGAKLLAKIAGVGDEKIPSTPSERFTITIDLGGDVRTFDKSKVPLTIEQHSEVQSFSTPQGSTKTLQAN